MHLVAVLLQGIGSLGFMLFGMKLMSDGIQKGTGESLHKILQVMTSNCFFAVLTGMAVTAIVQSSGATTVMTISFINAGVLSLTQSIGVILGANIGTTVTAWIVALVGFQFKLASIAVPAFGIGYFLTFFKHLHKEHLGESIMGFGLLFTGLGLLSSLIPPLSVEELSFLKIAVEDRALSVFVGLLSGFVLTVILHSSSATTAIVLTMAFGGVIGVEFAAASVLGSNVGSTIDAAIAAIGSKLNARRAAAVHVLFNVFGALVFLMFFHPVLALLYVLTPKNSGFDNITVRLALFHSMFNIVNTIIVFPFTKHLAAFVEWLIRPRYDDAPERYQLVFQETAVKESAEAHIFRAEIELKKMFSIAQGMLVTIRKSIQGTCVLSTDEIVTRLTKEEDYADQMQEQLSRFLIKTSHLSLSEKAKHNVQLMFSIADDIENITDHLCGIGLYFHKSIKGNVPLKRDDIEELVPYVGMVDECVDFVYSHLNRPLEDKQVLHVNQMTRSIESKGAHLKGLVRRRLEQGADVKAELLYMDIVRGIEAVGNYALSISRWLARML